jgi:FkbM family methyltransferase
MGLKTMLRLKKRRRVSQSTPGASMAAKPQKSVIDEVARIEPGLPFRFLDIGARGGVATAIAEFAWLKSLPSFSAVAIEPDPEECERLTASGEYERVLPVAVADKTGRRTLFITHNPACASLLEPDQSLNAGLVDARKFSVVATAEIECVRVDEALAAETFDMIKIDVQGVTHEVLMGCGDLLHGADAIWTDLYYEQVYQGQKLFADSDTMLRERGFCLAVATPVNVDGLVRQGNFLYIKDPASIETREPFLRLISVAAAMKRPALVEHLLRAHDRGFLTPDERSRLVAAGNLILDRQPKPLKWPPTEWRGLDIRPS